jgi:hypothetical protein
MLRFLTLRVFESCLKSRPPTVLDRDICEKKKGKTLEYFVIVPYNANLDSMPFEQNKNHSILPSLRCATVMQRNNLFRKFGLNVRPNYAIKCIIIDCIR